jgi:hypothetical protein
MTDLGPRGLECPAHLLLTISEDETARVRV